MTVVSTWRDPVDVTISNTTAERAILTYPVPAAWMIGNHGLRAKIRGVRVNVSGGNVFYTFRIKYGATTLWADLESFVSTSAECPFEIDFELYAKESAAAQELDGRISIHGGGTPTVGQGAMGVAMNVDTIIHGESAEDATTPLDLVVTVEMDTAHPAAIVHHRKSSIDLL